MLPVIALTYVQQPIEKRESVWAIGHQTRLEYLCSEMI
jgi:hypothetical protein